VRPGNARVLGELIDVAVGGAEVDPGVPAVVDQEPATGPVVKWRLIELSDPKTSTVLPSGSFSIQNPGRSSLRARPRTSRKKATVGSVLSVRVPTQASLMIRIHGPIPIPHLGRVKPT
jgi:hypothetical protein